MTKWQHFDKGLQGIAPNIWLIPPGCDGVPCYICNFLLPVIFTLPLSEVILLCKDKAHPARITQDLYQRQFRIHMLEKRCLRLRM
jgi:hypothetical protein